MIEWTKLKIPKNETIIKRHYSEGHLELLHIVTDNPLASKRFTLYQVNQNCTLTKIRSDNDPRFEGV